MTDAEKIADLERRVAELEAEKHGPSKIRRQYEELLRRSRGDGGQLPQKKDPDIYYLEGGCDACRKSGFCLCYRPDRDGVQMSVA